MPPARGVGPITSGPAADELRIGLDARLVSGTESGGVESVIAGLAAALSQLGDGPERYLFLVYRGETDWIEPYIGGASSLLFVPRSATRSLRRLARHTLGRVAPALGGWRRKWQRARRLTGPPASDGTLERASVNVVHLLKQSGFRTEIPSIYHPHDLQHLHLPEYFSEHERLRREATYRALCAQASRVAVTSSWIKQDVQRQYALDPEKVVVVPWAPVVEHYASPAASEMAGIRERFDLPDDYIFYPAQTWPHKNHDGLLRALAILNDRGQRIPLVSTGHRESHFGALRELAMDLGVWGQTRWLGFVQPRELMGIYQMARLTVIPTKFEAASGPMWEAFMAGVPVAASNVTSLPDQAGDAALLFDPYDDQAIAAALQRLWNDAALRAALIDRGKRNVARFTWERTARHFRAYYRLLGGRRLSEEDMGILQEQPLL